MATKKEVLQGPRGRSGPMGPMGPPGKNGNIPPEFYTKIGEINATLEASGEFHKNLQAELHAFRESNQEQYEKILEAISDVCNDLTTVKTSLAVGTIQISNHAKKLEVIEPKLDALTALSAHLSGKMVIVLLFAMGVLSVVFNWFGKVIGIVK